MNQNDSIEKAFYWLKKAADNDHTEAQYLLGNLYKQEVSNGSVLNYKQMAYWWNKAAEKEHANAQFFLGQLYKDGRGVPQDLNEALKWHMKAAENGNASSLDITNELQKRKENTKE